MNIDIDSPLYDIFSYFWVDQSSLCVCAKQHKNFDICHLAITGDLETIVQDPMYHLICPQKVDESLFYIKYNKTGATYFMKTEYPANKKAVDVNDDTVDFNERLEQLLTKKDKKVEKRHEQIQLLELENINFAYIFIDDKKKIEDF